VLERLLAAGVGAGEHERSLGSSSSSADSSCSSSSIAEGKLTGLGELPGKIGERVEVLPDVEQTRVGLLRRRPARGRRGHAAGPAGW
jgi:hypothetical protein